MNNGQGRYDEDRFRSRRGFASMDDERRRGASLRERARWGAPDDEDDERGYSTRSPGGFRAEEDDERPGRGGSRRGLAWMDEERPGQLASLGGRARWGERDDEDAERGFYSMRWRGGPRDEEEQDDRGGRGIGRRGFASMDEERRREIASMGGRAAHRYGSAHEWDSREAREAGHRGSLARWGEEDDDRGYSTRGRARFEEEDDDRGRVRWGERFVEDDDRRFSVRGPERDEEGRFISRRRDDDDDRVGRGGGRRGVDEARFTPAREREGASRRASSGRGGRGFASMDEDRLREIASRGGRAAHESGHAHEWSSREAREAGRRGAQARRH